MRSILLALGLLAALVSVEAIFRPSGYKKHYGGGYDDCDDTHTKKPSTAKVTDAPTDAPTTEAPTTTAVPTTTTAAPKCPEGFTAFNRTPSAANLQTSVWCMKAVLQKEPIAVESANALCAAQTDGAVLTALESDTERAYFTALLLVTVQSYGYTSGAIAIDGRRNTDCTVRNRTVLDSPPCSDPTQVFHLTDGHTDPSYMWSHWSANEPSANMWTYDIEECIQLAVIPSNPPRNNLLNDIYCNFVQPPNDPDYTLYWNFGALCGVAPK